MSAGAEDDLTRVERIRRRRSVQAANAALTAIVSVQLAFAAFAIGHALGPAPMRRIELVAGIALSFLLGIALSVPFVRRRLEAGAHLKVDVTEGRHRRRVLVFDDHLVLDQEVVMFEQLTSVALEGSRLVVKYEDPIHGGPMLRELEGSIPRLVQLEAGIQERGSS